jgi:photosystem II stability/assembly factor-like uncharacterized protein
MRSRRRLPRFQPTVRAPYNLPALPRHSRRLCVLLGLLLVLWGHGARAQSSAAVSLGPDRGWMIALAAAPGSAASPPALWAVSNGGRVFRSADGGGTWSPSSSGITDPVVTGLTVSPAYASDRTVFAAADNGVFRSRDAGLTWQTEATGLGGRFCREVALDPQFATDSTAYVATDSGVFVSHDSGDHWAPTSLLSSVVSIAAGSGGNLLAGESNGGLERSADGGVSWTSVSGFPNERIALAIANVGSTATAGTDQGVFWSDDRGATWQQSSLAIDRIDAMAGAVDGTMYAGSASGDGVYRSADAGRTWIPTGALQTPFVASLAIATDATGSEHVWAGTAGGGVFASNSGGASWTAVNTGLAAARIDTLSTTNGDVLAAGLGGASVVTAGEQPRDLNPGTGFVDDAAWSGNHIYVGTEDRGLRLSFDAGQSWTDSTIDSARASAVAHTPAYSSDGTVLAAADYVYRSTDAGLTWQQAAGLAGNDVEQFVFSPEFDTDGTVFAATINHRVYRSTDGGLSWSPASTGLPSGQIAAVLMSPDFSTDATVYAATSGEGVYRSTDRGATWAPLPQQPPDPVVSALGWNAGGGLLAGTQRGLFVLGRSGWTSLQPGWDLYVTALADVTSGGGEQLYAGTLGNGVWLFTLSVPPPPSPLQTPSPAPSATPIQTETTPKKTLRAWLVPKPTRQGDLALLRIQGPARARVSVSLTAHGWERGTALTLTARGHGSYGFFVPHERFAVSVSGGGGATTFSVLPAP